MKASLLDPHLGTIIWTLITFVLVLLVLKKWAWPPILSALDEREQSIRIAIEGAEQARQEAETVLIDHRAKLVAADWRRGLRNLKHTVGPSLCGAGSL